MCGLILGQIDLKLNINSDIPAAVAVAVMQADPEVIPDSGLTFLQLPTSSADSP